MRRIHAIKPPNEIAMPPLRLVRLPPQPCHQAIRQSHVGRVTNDSINLLDLSNGIERRKGGAKRSKTRPKRRHDVLEGKKVAHPPWLVVIQQAPILLAA